jgi:adenylyl-sulfate kinase
VTGGAAPGFVVWLTGLPAAGKTTIAGLVADDLESRDLPVERLDGDVVRRHLSRGLGYSREDRDANVERIAWVASRLARVGGVVVVAAISPYDGARRSARALVEEHARFVLVHVATAVEECRRRDPKGMYALALAGEIEHFTGVDDPYEAPTTPELRLDTTGESPIDSARRVLETLDALGLLPFSRANRGLERAGAER